MRKDTIYNLSDDELTLAKDKNSDKNRLGFAILLKYFQLESHYPKHIKLYRSINAKYHRESIKYFSIMH